MAVTMNATLKELLLASNLGLSRDYPLAGWQILTILYYDGAGNEALTANILAKRYNAGYLDLENSEAPLSDAVLKKVLDVLEARAHFVEVASRKVRMQMKNGGYHIQPSRVYKITSSGIEYLTMMRHVMDAENTVTANINRIDEYCQLVQKLSEPNLAYVQLIRRLEQRQVQLTYLGDLDSRGIQMADHLLDQLDQTKATTLMALQTPGRVVNWLNRYGKSSRPRTRLLSVKHPLLQQEIQSVNLFGKFVEQEQLIHEYETLISDWLKTG